MIISHDVTNPSTHCFCLEGESEVAQSCLTRDPMDCSLPRSSVHGVLQGRTVEWAAISFSSSNPGIKPRALTWQTDALLSEPPYFILITFL